MCCVTSLFLQLAPYLLAVWPGMWIVKFILGIPNTVKEHKVRIEKDLVLGKWIGVFERLIAIYLIAHDAWAGLGFIAASKAILRFPEIARDKENTSDKQPEENLQHVYSSYILLGTFVSLTLAGLLALLNEYLTTCSLCCGN